MKFAGVHFLFGGGGGSFWINCLLFNSEERFQSYKKVEPCNDLNIHENILLLFLTRDCLINNTSSDILNLFLTNKKMEGIFSDKQFKIKSTPLGDMFSREDQGRLHISSNLVC